ncbi:MAG TPA: serine kinase [Firmicutes bacterium]|nr:serine kinase [Bacillota bacterium]
MKLAEVLEALSLAVDDPEMHNKEVEGGYCSDLLSDVMAKAAARSIWVTNQVHPNVVAVASLIDAAAVIIAGGMKPEEETVKKAEELGIPLFSTDLTAFDVVGRLYALGLRGKSRNG